jgi:uncharacterized protein YidB (DUF937 family)
MGVLGGLGGLGRRGGGGMSPMTMALLGLLAYRTMKGKGRLADMLGRGTAPEGGPDGPVPGGIRGGTLSAGLQDLLARFRQGGQEAKAKSWVSTGPNESIAPDELEKTLGEERVQWLMEQTGMGKEELLAGLSTALPDAVDRLTPEGRVPTEEELDRAEGLVQPTKN